MWGYKQDDVIGVVCMWRVVGLMIKNIDSILKMRNETQWENIKICWCNYHNSNFPIKSKTIT